VLPACSIICTNKRCHHDGHLTKNLKHWYRNNGQVALRFTASVVTEAKANNTLFTRESIMEAREHSHCSMTRLFFVMDANRCDPFHPTRPNFQIRQRWTHFHSCSLRKPFVGLFEEITWRVEEQFSENTPVTIITYPDGGFHLLKPNHLYDAKTALYVVTLEPYLCHAIFHQTQAIPFPFE
jgi:hypothetical protein